MKKEKLELRMYFFVAYQLTGIQQGIQAGHAALEYAKQYGNDPQFIDFVDNWKTWIILNGGTTNSRRDKNKLSIGSLNQLADQLSLANEIDNGIKYSYFCEPDLENALTAICFICDERVFDYEKYPDFKVFLKNHIDKPLDYSVDFKLLYDDLKFKYTTYFIEWGKTLGGSENVFLRELLKGKKFA